MSLPFQTWKGELKPESRGSTASTYSFRFSFKGLKSQITVVSKLPDASRCPSGLNATRITTPACPWKVRFGWPPALA